MNTIVVQHIFGGKIQSYQIKEKKFQSGYLKKEAYSIAYISKEGLSQDKQADKRYHGGIDKALLFASTNHSKTYQEEFKQPIDIAIFSANVFVNTLDETNVCVGDIYSIGKLTVEVTQPRQPCWKIGAIFSKEVSKFIKRHSATGWYVKVLQEGTLKLDESVKLLERKSDITIKDMTHYLDTKKVDKNTLDTILEADFIAQSYKNDILKCEII